VLLTDAAPGVAFDWGFFIQSLFQPSEVFLTGLARTVYISVLAQALGTVGGLVIELLRRSRWRALRAAGSTYVWLIRGTPLLVQLVIVYNGLAAMNLYRFTDWTIGPVVVLGVIQAAIITLAANEAAYMAEIIRAALDAIDVGQSEAGTALGMTPAMTMRMVLLPQAARIVVPPLGNEFNLMMKSTSLLSVIGLQEMFLTAQAINSATFKTFEIFLTVAAYYLFLTTVWAFVQRWLERRFGDPAGHGVVLPTMRERLFGGRRAVAEPQTPGRTQ
jgi:polar amino acid transport system permease protein